MNFAPVYVGHKFFLSRPIITDNKWKETLQESDRDVQDWYQWTQLTIHDMHILWHVVIIEILIIIFATGGIILSINQNKLTEH